MKTMKIGIKFFITILFLSFFARATECKAEETLRYDDLKIMKKVCIYVDISGSVKSMEEYREYILSLLYDYFYKSDRVKCRIYTFDEEVSQLGNNYSSQSEEVSWDSFIDYGKKNTDLDKVLKNILDLKTDDVELENGEINEPWEVIIISDMYDSKNSSHYETTNWGTVQNAHLRLITWENEAERANGLEQVKLNGVKEIRLQEGKKADAVKAAKEVLEMCAEIMYGCGMNWESFSQLSSTNGKADEYYVHCNEPLPESDASGMTLVGSGDTENGCFYYTEGRELRKLAGVIKDRECEVMLIPQITVSFQTDPFADFIYEGSKFEVIIKAEYDGKPTDIMNNSCLCFTERNTKKKHNMPLTYEEPVYAGSIYLDRGEYQVTVERFGKCAVGIRQTVLVSAPKIDICAASDKSQLKEILSNIAVTDEEVRINLSDYIGCIVQTGQGKHGLLHNPEDKLVYSAWFVKNENQTTPRCRVEGTNLIILGKVKEESIIKIEVEYSELNKYTQGVGFVKLFKVGDVKPD